MLLCAIQDVQAGAVLGAVVTDPQKPDHELLRTGVKLEEPLLARLRSRGVTQMWVEDDFARDLDGTVGAGLTGARLTVYSELRNGLAACSRNSLTVASVQTYRRAMVDLVTQVVESRQYVAMTDAIFGTTGQATHGANVAYLSLHTALHVEEYVIGQQTKLQREAARDFSVLGLAGLLHDIGKTKLSAEVAGFHDVHTDDSHPRPEGYLSHVGLGQTLLRDGQAPSRAVYVALNHHQRFDGGGWPDLTEHTSGQVTGTLDGGRIHIFARIVAAANVLDNLMSEVDGARRPAVAALHAFASSRFDGWFDPTVRRAMLLRIPPFAVGTDVTLSDGRRGAVMAPCLTSPCRPLVRLRTPEGASSDSQPQTIDLSKTPGVTITQALGVDVSKYLYELPSLSATPVVGLLD